MNQNTVSFEQEPRVGAWKTVASASQSLDVAGTVSRVAQGWRSRFMAALTLCSNSTNVSFGHASCGFLRGSQLRLDAPAAW